MPSRVELESISSAVCRAPISVGVRIRADSQRDELFQRVTCGRRDHSHSVHDADQKPEASEACLPALASNDETTGDVAAIPTAL